MIQIEDVKQQLKALQSKLNGVGESLDLPKMKEELQTLTEQQHSPDFWNDVKNAQQVSQRAKNLQDKIENYSKLTARAADAEELLEICDDEAMLSETAEEVNRLEKEINELHIATLLSGKYDANNAILTLHAGAGGTEAQDWVQMLYRMYTRYAERRGYKVQETDFLAGEEAGIKSVTFNIIGANAYGYLKAEKGVHRLVRISPFDAQKRRHTSFASLEVMPELPQDNDIVIEDKDLKVDTYRSSGAGGTAHQQDGKRHSHNAYPHGHCGVLPDAAQSDTKQRAGNAYAQKQACRTERARTDGGSHRHKGGNQKDRVGQSDSLLRVLSLHPRKGSSHQL